MRRRRTGPRARGQYAHEDARTYGHSLGASRWNIDLPPRSAASAVYIDLNVEHAEHSVHETRTTASNYGRPPPRHRPPAVAVGPVVLSLPAGFTVEQQEPLDYGRGVTGRSALIRARSNPVAEGGARCQVAWTEFPVGAFPPDARPRTRIRIEPVDGSAPFDMSRVNGSDTDLAGTIGETQSFIVDCDDVRTAEFIAARLRISR